MNVQRSILRLLALSAIATTPCNAADAVLDWNAVALEQIVAAQPLAPDQARSLAMVHVAMFDAINAIEHRYTGHAFRERAEPGTSADAAAAAAARAVLGALLPDRRAAVETAYSQAVARIAESPGKTAGVALGERAAAACLALRADDGSAVPNTYRPKTTPGAYVPTALPVATQWAGVKPWFMRDGAQFRPGAPPALDSDLWVRDYNEIRQVGARESATRTAAQTEAARFWTITGPAAWNPVVRSLAESRGLDLLDSARLMALVNMAATDAFVAVFDAKYEYAFWRPVTAIRNGDIDDNDATQRDPAWVPLVDTPMHPEYPCAHCITSGAVGRVLEATFGAGEVPAVVMTSPTAPGVTHRWTRIADYVDEVGSARIWGGIHYRNSVEVGTAMGQRIGDLAVGTLLPPAD